MGNNKYEYDCPITLEVRESNLPAISLYEKNGFEKVTIRKKGKSFSCHSYLKQFILLFLLIYKLLFKQHE